MSQFWARNHRIRSFTFVHDVRSHMSQLPKFFAGFASDISISFLIIAAGSVSSSTAPGSDICGLISAVSLI
jgi:hypothetical protein